LRLYGSREKLVLLCACHVYGTRSGSEATM
jgi:hypothetical protein